MRWLRHNDDTGDSFLCLLLSFGRYSHASMVSIRPVPTKATRRFNWSASTSTSMKPQVSHHWTVKATRVSWWRHQMETFSALLAICAGNSPVTGEFPAQRPVTRSFDVFFDLRLNRQLSKQWGRWWFETLPRSLWRHCNVSIHVDGLMQTKCYSIAFFYAWSFRYSISHEIYPWSYFALFVVVILLFLIHSHSWFKPHS